MCQVAEANRFGFNEALWLVATGRTTREVLLSEAGLRSFSGPRIGSVGASYFVDYFVSCWGNRDAYRLLLDPVEGNFL